MSDIRPNPAATWADFQRQRPDRQAGILAVLQACHEHRLSVRCEAVATEIIIVIGRGYSSAKRWIDQFVENR